MNYKRKSDTNYHHYGYEDMILIGVDKSVTKEEAELMLHRPAQSFDDGFYGKAMQLGISRSAVVSAVEEWNEGRKKENAFHGAYWEILLDFLYFLYDRTELELARDIQPLFPNYNDMQLYDAIVKMKGNTSSIGKNAEKIAVAVCFAGKVSKDILTTGKGEIYWVEGHSREMLKADGNFSDITKEKVAKAYGIDETKVDVIPIQVFQDDNHMSPQLSGFLDILIKKLVKAGA